MKKWKQVLCITLIIVGVLLVSAVVIGILNATVFDGAINFGWTSYHYDSTGYTVGEGSVFDTEIRKISVDWLEGDVQIEVCEDDFISVSEFCREELSDVTRLHWRADGAELSVKSRESAWVFGSDPEKKLTLRIPARMLAQMESLTVKTHDGDISLVNVSARTINLECGDGDLRATLPFMPEIVSTTALGGQTTFLLPQNASFSLQWTKNEGVIITDFDLQKEADRYVVGSGKSQFFVTTDDENLIVNPLP